jgi:hypothetical protein
VADDLVFPRGLAVLGDTLYVSVLGGMPCPAAYPRCKGGDVPGAADAVAGEHRIIEESRGQVLAFAIAPDGSLADRRVVLDDLPIVNSEHAVNGLAVGPDDHLYLSIGGLDQTREDPGFAGRSGRPHPDLVGTVVRFAPGQPEPEVHARGLRNVYGLAFDPRGGLWGVDNDGPTADGWRMEEVVRIEEGADYGFPSTGTFSSGRAHPPVWTTPATGSSGILWAEEAGMGPGLLLGSCGRLDALGLADLGGRWAVASRTEFRQLLELPGCVTDLAAMGSGRVALTLWGRSGLYVLQVQPEDR